MSVINIRDWDPEGQFQPTPTNKPKGQDVLEFMTAAIGAINKRKKSNMDNAFREAATRELNAGTSEASYEYDPATGNFKAKVEPKKVNVGDLVNQFKTRQQFGVDPVTGEAIPEDQLKKPRFGYTEDILSQILAGNGLAGNLPDPAAAAPAQAAPAAPADKTGFAPSGAGIDTGSFVDGQQPRFLDPLILEYQNALAAGANPIQAKARLQQLQQGRGKSGGV